MENCMPCDYYDPYTGCCTLNGQKVNAQDGCHNHAYDEPELDWEH